VTAPRRLVVSGEERPGLDPDPLTIPEEVPGLPSTSSDERAFWLLLLAFTLATMIVVALLVTSRMGPA